MMNGTQVLASLASVLSQTQEVNGNPPPAKLSVLFSIADRIVELWLSFLTWFGSLWEPIVKPIFRPINVLLARIYMPWAMYCAIGLFVIAMAWVCLFMDKEYVNLGRKNKSLWTDLRLWTVISMLPHVFVYWYFSS